MILSLGRVSISKIRRISIELEDSIQDRRHDCEKKKEQTVILKRNVKQLVRICDIEKKHSC